MKTTTGKFARGTNGGTFKCDDCGRFRQMGNLGVNTGAGLICVDCFDKAGWANAVADGDMTTAEFHAKFGEHAWSCEYAKCSLISRRHILTAEERARGGAARKAKLESQAFWAGIA